MSRQPIGVHPKAEYEDYVSFHQKDYIARGRLERHLMSVLPLKETARTVGWIVGHSGTGKSWLANWYAEQAEQAGLKVRRLPSPTALQSDGQYLTDALRGLKGLGGVGKWAEALQPFMLLAAKAVYDSVTPSGDPNFVPAETIMRMILEGSAVLGVKGEDKIKAELERHVTKLQTGDRRQLLIVDDIQALGPQSSQFIKALLESIGGQPGPVALMLIGEVTQARDELRGLKKRSAGDRAKRELLEMVIERHDEHGDYMGEAVRVGHLEEAEVGALLRKISERSPRGLFDRKAPKVPSEEIGEAEVYEAVKRRGDADALYTAQALKELMSTDPPLLAYDGGRIRAEDGWETSLPAGTTSALRRRLESNNNWVRPLLILDAVPLDGLPVDWLTDVSLREGDEEISDAFGSLLRESGSTSWIRKVPSGIGAPRPRTDIAHQRFLSAVREYASPQEKSRAARDAVGLVARGMSSDERDLLPHEALALAAWISSPLIEPSALEQVAIVGGFLQLGGHIGEPAEEEEVLRLGDAAFDTLSASSAEHGRLLVRYALARDAYEWADEHCAWLKRAEEYSGTLRDSDLLLALEMKKWRSLKGNLREKAAGLERVLETAPMSSDDDRMLNEVAKSLTDAHRVARALWGVGDSVLAGRTLDLALQLADRFEGPIFASAAGPPAPFRNGAATDLDLRQLRLIRLFFDRAYVCFVLGHAAKGSEANAMLQESAQMVRRIRRLPSPIRNDQDRAVDLLAWRLVELGMLERSFLIGEGRPKKPTLKSTVGHYWCLARHTSRWEASLLSVEEARSLYQGDSPTMPPRLDDPVLEQRARDLWAQILSLPDFDIDDWWESICKNRPENASTTEFFAYLSYMIFRAGMKGAWAEKHREELSEILCQSDPTRVILRWNEVAERFLDLINAPDKLQGIGEAARALSEFPHVGQQLLSFLDGAQFMEWAGGFNRVGPTVASITGTEFGFEDLTANMAAADAFAKEWGYSSMGEMVRYIQSVTGEEPKLIDTVLHYVIR